MTKFHLFILSVFFIGFTTCKTPMPVSSANNKITFLDRGDDTVFVSTDIKPILILFINEPSCTGCKENLAKYLNSLKSKFTQYAVVTSYPDPVSRGVYEAYLNYRFKRLEGIYYSLSQKESSFLLGKDLISIDTRKNPQVFLIKNNETRAFSYDEIFIDVHVSTVFKNSLESCK